VGSAPRGGALGTDLQVWDRVLPLLPPGLRIIRYDMRGHLHCVDRPEAYAALIAEFIE